MKFLQILVLIVGFVAFANAQKAILTGTVYDANGAVIPQAKVIAINEKGEKFETLTNETGEYILKLYFNQYGSIAKYDITVEKDGFATRVLKDFRFVGFWNDQMHLDFALDAGADNNTEPCGHGGGGCKSIETKPAKISIEIFQQPLEELPKEQDKTKRKKINK